jgi:hypothetical protein
VDISVRFIGSFMRASMGDVDILRAAEQLSPENVFFLGTGAFATEHADVVPLAMVILINGFDFWWRQLPPQPLRRRSSSG